VLNELNVTTVGDLMFVANVGEEELGDLRGMKALFRDRADIDWMVGLEPDPGGSTRRPRRAAPAAQHAPARPARLRRAPVGPPPRAHGRAVRGRRQ